MKTDDSPNEAEDYVLDDVQAVAQYRSVSTLAVLAVILGLFSLLALFTDALLVVPLAGTIVGLLAVWRIHKSEGQLAGRGPAILGLALSVAIGSGLVAQRITLKRLVAAQATSWATQWCQLVMDGELEAALEFTRDPSTRRPFGQSLAEYYATDESAAAALETFRQDEVIELLTSAPEGSQVEPGELIGAARDSTGSFVVLQAFELNVPDDSQVDGPREFQLQLRKSGTWTGTPDQAWYVTDHVMEN